jgi:hypothetical protein
VTDEEPEGITLEEILIEMIDTQTELVDALSSGEPLADGEGLKARLQDLREVLENALDEPEDD